MHENSLQIRRKVLEDCESSLHIDLNHYIVISKRMQSQELNKKIFFRILSHLQALGSQN